MICLYNLHDKIMLRHRSWQGNKTILKALNFHSSTGASVNVKWTKFENIRTLSRADGQAKLTYQERRALFGKVTKNPTVTSIHLFDQHELYASSVW